MDQNNKLATGINVTTKETINGGSKVAKNKAKKFLQFVLTTRQALFLLVMFSDKSYNELFYIT